MCLLLFAQGVNPRFPLIVASNRDEFHARPTEPAHWWHDVPLLAGRDSLGGGTWFGVNARGSFAALTNYRDPVRNDPKLRSRGALVVNALTDDGDARRQLRALAANAAEFNGYNLIFGDARQVHSFCNVHSEPGDALQPGVYGLSNHLLETPWPKVTRGKPLLLDYLESEQAPAVEPLFDLLSDRRQAPDHELPDTGVSRDWERLLSPMFIVSGAYGTRASTVLIVADNGEAVFAERSFDSDGRALETREFRFRTVPE